MCKYLPQNYNIKSYKGRYKVNNKGFYANGKEIELIEKHMNLF